MVLADDGDFSSADGRADVSQLVLELKKADRPDTLLNSMVKINDVVDGDEDGVLENPFAAEVCTAVLRCLWCSKPLQFSGTLERLPQVWYRECDA